MNHWLYYVTKQLLTKGSRHLKERNSQKSKDQILTAAETAFARKGIHGTRIDEIAEKANINKRMIYAYFGSKEGLYKAVLINVYNKLNSVEISLLSEDTPPGEAIKKLIELHFNYLKENRTYVNLLLWENLNQGDYIRDREFEGIRNPAIERMRGVLQKGMNEGVFHPNLDIDQVILSLLTFSFSYFSNTYTLSKLLRKDLNDADNIKSRLQNMTEMFLKYLCD